MEIITRTCLPRSVLSLRLHLHVPRQIQDIWVMDSSSYSHLNSRYSYLNKMLNNNMSLGCSSAISSSIYQKTAESTQPRPLCYSTGYRKRPTYLVNASWGI